MSFHQDTFHQRKLSLTKEETNWLEGVLEVIYLDGQYLVSGVKSEFITGEQWESKMAKRIMRKLS